jgi:prevent-host-death family protein
MGRTAKTRAQAGLRELRQDLSALLARVAKGERIEVTEHGRPVALLIPLPAGDSVLERMLAEGRCTRPSCDLRDLPPPAPRRRGQRSVSRALEELRAERLY